VIAHGPRAPPRPRARDPYQTTVRRLCARRRGLGDVRLPGRARVRRSRSVCRARATARPPTLDGSCR